MRTKCAECRPRSRTNSRPASTRDKLLDGGRAEIRLRSDGIIRKTVGGGARSPFGRLEGQASTELGTQFVHRLLMVRPSRSARVSPDQRNVTGAWRGGTPPPGMYICLLEGRPAATVGFLFRPVNGKKYFCTRCGRAALLVARIIARATSQPSRL
jgi:hypothetical protein